MIDNVRQTVLIVDNTAQNLRILGELLRDDFVIKATTKSSEVLDIALSYNQPDLILLDVMMPEINGYELCSQLKSNSATENIPIIFITSKDEDIDEIKGFDLGAVEYITKPFNPMIVKARVKTHAELKKLRDMLENNAYLDGLTMIANRRKFDEFYDIYWNVAKRKSEAISIIMIDVDYFKLYNDHYGHLQGDECLKNIANMMKKVIKRNADLLARYGGEEFVCILPSTSKADAVAIGEKLREVVENALIPHEQSLVSDHVTISLGISNVVPDMNIRPDMLIQAADRALYLSKGNGRNCVSYADIE